MPLLDYISNLFNYVRLESRVSHLCLISEGLLSYYPLACYWERGGGLGEELEGMSDKNNYHNISFLVRGGGGGAAGLGTLGTIIDNKIHKSTKVTKSTERLYFKIQNHQTSKKDAFLCTRTR